MNSATQHHTRRPLAIGLLAVVLPASALLLAACGSNTTDTTNSTVAVTTDDGATPATPAPGGMGGGMQVANPASQYCVEQGGIVEVRDGADGQVGWCLLPDGTEIDEWEFFNSQSATTTGG